MAEDDGAEAELSRGGRAVCWTTTIWRKSYTKCRETPNLHSAMWSAVQPCIHFLHLKNAVRITWNPWIQDSSLSSLEKRQDTNMMDILKLYGDFSHKCAVLRYEFSYHSSRFHSTAILTFFWVYKNVWSLWNSSPLLVKPQQELKFKRQPTLFLKLNQKQLLVLFRFCNMSRNIWIL